MSIANRPTIEFDDDAEVMTLNGIEFSYSVIEMLLQPTPPGNWYRVKDIIGKSIIIDRLVETNIKL